MALGRFHLGIPSASREASNGQTSGYMARNSKKDLTLELGLEALFEESLWASMS
jgi:hypothetical protein